MNNYESYYGVLLHELEEPDKRDEIWVFDTYKKFLDFENELNRKLYDAGPDIQNHFEVRACRVHSLNGTTTEYLDLYIGDLYD